MVSQDRPEVKYIPLIWVCTAAVLAEHGRLDVRHDTQRQLCYKDRLAGVRRAGDIPGPSMYVIDIHYNASLERIDDALERHRAYLQPLFERGIFIAAGPKVPREGGVILAARIDRGELDAILETDPFVTEGLATYRVTEFKITRAAQGFNVPALP